jgi:septal ring factor EnvC (AmiA/AmiB activator)
MTTEHQPEQVIPSEDAPTLDKAEEQPRSRRLAYKSVLTAVVVGIVVISALSFSKIQRQEKPLDELQIQDSNTQTREVIKRPEPEISPAEGKVEQIDQRLTSLSRRIDRGFEAQIAHSADVKKSLASVVEGVRAIKAAVADIAESNHALRQRIDDSIARLNTLIKETQKRRVAQKKPAARPKPAPAKTPPFHVDAIDVWDDMTYVAISQAGRVAFLKSGEQQSGWTVAGIDRLKGRVEFKGPHGQNHSVSLQR